MADTLRQQRGYLRFWTATTVSGFGSYLTTLALQVLVLTDLHGSATDVGLVNAARWAAYLALGLVAGVWIDRVRRRPVLVATDLGRGLLLGLVGALALTGHLTVALLVALVAVFGLLSLAGDAASQSLLPALVPRPLLVRANARLEQSGAAAQTTGPALAGVITTTLGAPVAILLDAVSYLVSGLMLVTLPHAEPAPSAVPRSARREVGEGLRWVYRHPTLTPLALNTHGWFLCWAVLGTVQVSYALTGLGFSALTLGLVFALGGLAALAGASATERSVARWGPGRVMLASRLGYGPGVVLVALAPSAADGHAAPLAVLLMAVSQLLIGLGMGLEGAAEMAFRQAVTPERLQGRMNTTLRSVNRAMIVVGAPLGGLLADTAGPRTALWVTAAGLVLVGLTFSRTRTVRAVMPQEPV